MIEIITSHATYSADPIASWNFMGSNGRIAFFPMLTAFLKSKRDAMF